MNGTVAGGRAVGGAARDGSDDTDGKAVCVVSVLVSACVYTCVSGDVQSRVDCDSTGREELSIGGGRVWLQPWIEAGDGLSVSVGRRRRV